MDAPALSNERTEELVCQIETKEARNELILGHVRLGRAIVRRYATKVGDSSELTGVMQLAIVQAVNDFVIRGRDANITGYIVANIHYAISAHLRTLSALATRSSIQRVRKYRGQEGVPIPKMLDIDDADLQQTDFGLQQLEADELAESLCINDQERDVLHLRRLGYTDIQIGEQLGLSRWTAWSIRQGIQERYNHVHS